MKLKFNPDGLAVPVDFKLIKHLTTLTEKESLPTDVNSLVFNFRDSSYSPEAGGYHPVEIRISLKDGMWDFDYITDFSYQGGAFPELVKDIDFDFTANELSVLFMSVRAITSNIEFFNLWQNNFISYLSYEVFDEVTVSSDC